MISPKQTAHYRLVLSNAKRMQEMGLFEDKSLQFFHTLSRSPIREVSCKFANKLSHALDNLEFRNAHHGSEVVPILSPDMSIEIGQTISKGLSFRVSISEAVHWLLAGASGSGKTNLICVIERAVRNLIACTLIDHKDEGLRFINAVPNAAYLPLDKQRWNPLLGVGNQENYIRYIALLLTRLMALLPVTANAVRAKLLNLCSDQNDLPAIADLSDIFQKLAQQEMRSSLHTASRGFGDLAISMGRWAAVRKGQWPFENHMLNVIPLKDLPPAFEHFYIALLLKHMTDHASLQGHATELRHLIFFDEALTYMGKEMEPATGSGRTNQVAEMMRTSRSYGLSIVAAVQSVSKIQDSVMDNAGIFIAFRAYSVQEAKICCKRLGFDESRYLEILNLDTGTAWVITPHVRQAVKIKIPFIDLGSYPSEASISEKMKPLWEKWDANTVFAPAKTNQDTVINFREILGEVDSQKPIFKTDLEKSEYITKESISEPERQCPVISSRSKMPPVSPILEEYFVLLRSCKLHPDFAATSHYKALGLSARRGNRIKAKVVELGWVNPVRIASSKAGRPKETLHLTEKGEGVLNERT